MRESKQLLIDYVGGIEGKSCSICKLALRKKQKIYQCPYCGYLFHKEHIEEWLENHEDCPVCNKIIQFDISDRNIEGEVSDIATLTSTSTPNVFKNNSYLGSVNFYLLRILSTIVGIGLFGVSVLFLILLATKHELIEEEMENFVLILSIVTVLFGLTFIVLPNINYLGNKLDWKNIILFENGILIERRKRPRTIKLDPHSIESIELEQYFGTKFISERKNYGTYTATNLTSILQHKIKLRINLINKTSFFISSMCQFDEVKDSNEMYLYLKERMKDWYNIDVISSVQAKDKQIPQSE